MTTTQASRRQSLNPRKVKKKHKDCTANTNSVTDTGNSTQKPNQHINSHKNSYTTLTPFGEGHHDALAIGQHRYAFQTPELATSSTNIQKFNKKIPKTGYNLHKKKPTKNQST